MNFEFLNTEEYAFLKQPEFQKYLMLLTIGGSHAYGMNVDTPEHTSDIDLRGILFHSKEEILRMEPCMMYTDDLSGKGSGTVAGYSKWKIYVRRWNL